MFGFVKKGARMLASFGLTAAELLRAKLTIRRAAIVGARRGSGGGLGDAAHGMRAGFVVRRGFWVPLATL
jgi:hypothetical protein